MTNSRSRRLISAAAWLGVCAFVPGWGSSASSRGSLLDALVWGPEREIDVTVYAAPLAEGIRAHRARFQTYQSRRPRPLDPTSEKMIVYEAAIRYERRLVAVSTAPEAPERAAAYVDDLQPCYEWEGYHACPEREASFAAAYQASHPDGPFSHYLPLLEAHRWLCTAEAHDYEKSPTEAARARRSHAAALTRARQSSSLLVRTAAEELATRGRCLPPQ